MKTNKLLSLKKILYLLIFSMLLLSFMVSISLAKYISDEKAYYGEDESIDFTINSVFVVNTADELFAAINQGYTYVQLDKEIENPLIITQKAENLNNDLILDLNGIEIQRNGYDPILNINEGVRLTVVDSSDEQTGGLYNPVGSVFNINGGTLTVVTGFFESGPRYSEYYTYNNLILNNESNSNTKRTLVENNPEKVNYHTNSKSEIKEAPIIKSYPTKKGEITYNHGNLYFDSDITKGDITINKDTYCYFTTSETTVSNATNTSMADWYYTYYIDKDTYTYTGYEKNNDTDIEVTIYGYNNIISKAEKKTKIEEYYAAIQMNDGNLEVQDGSFYQYFGVNTTACVNAQGGNITVNKGQFSSRIPDATIYDELNSVNIKESDKEAFDTNYFTNFNNDTLSKKGESYCILNGGNAIVKIHNGKYYSSNNNIISMQGGDLSIMQGNLTKNLTNGSSNDVNTKSAINMKQGKLSIYNSNVIIKGDKSYAIYSTITGENNFNIYNTDFDVKGDNSTGIYSIKGTVHLNSDTESNMVIEGNECKGILVSDGGSIVSNSYSYNIKGDKSYGIYSQFGTIELNNGNIILDSNDNCYGIYADSTDEIDINISNSTISIGFDKISTKNGKIRASVGVFLSSSNTSSIMNLVDTNVYSNELGVVSNGGTINLSGNGKITTNKASAIAIKNGDINFLEDSNYIIVSSNTTSNSNKNSYDLTLPTRTNDKLEDADYVNTDGIYVNGGSFTSKGYLNITHTGLYNNTDITNYIYSSLVVTSYAVRVYGGDVVIKKGTINSLIGGGIYAGKNGISKGSIVLGNNNDNDLVEVYAKGNKVGEEYDAIGTKEGSWQSYKSITGGHAVELDGGNITIYNGIYEAQFGNGIYVNGTDDINEENGIITIYDGSFYGYMNAESGVLEQKTGPSAFYGLKVVGGSETNIYGGFFDGGNGGAFITGVTKIANKKIISSKKANVYIYEGIFGSSSGAHDAFNVYDDTNIIFGAYTEKELSEKYTEDNYEQVKELIVLNGTSSNGFKASIALNPITNNSDSTKTTNIYIYYGTYNLSMYFDPNIQGKSSYTSYNVNKYTICNGTQDSGWGVKKIWGDQVNTNPIWYEGKK